MRVLVISAAFPPLQAPEADHIFHLCQHLTDYGLDVQILTTRGKAAPNQSRFQVHSLMRHWGWSDLPRFLTFLKRCSPDAVLLMFIDWIYNNHPMITFAPTFSKALFPHVPFVTKLPNPIGVPPQHSGFSRLFRKAAVRLAGRKHVDYRFGTLLPDSDRLIVFSNQHLACVSDLCPEAEKKSVLIPPPSIMRMCPENNDASRHDGRAALGVNDDDFLVAYFGYIYPGKGVETLLRAIQIVSRQRSNIRLVLVGGIIALKFADRPSYTQEVQTLPKQLGIEDKIIWTGEYAWDSDQASRYLRAADTCVLPFDNGVHLNNSSFSSVVAHELPIITTQGAYIEEAFVHQETVLLCPPKSPDAIAAAIMGLMDKPDLRQRLRIGAQKLSQEWFSWETAVNRTIQALSKAS